MATILGQSFEPRHCKTLAKGIYEDGGPTYQKRWQDWSWNYQLEHKVRPVGVRVPDEIFPRKIQLTRGKKLYDHNTIGFAPLVSDRFKNVIETIEPGVHQFMPIEAMHMDGTPYGEPFWVFYICSVIDAVNPELGGVKKVWGIYKSEESPDKYRWQFDVDVPGYDNLLAVHKERIEGRAAWIDRRFFPATSRFFSAAVVERLYAAGMEGWDEESQWQEL